MFFGYSPEQMAQWQATQSKTTEERKQEQDDWLADFRDTHPFCSSWTDGEILHWRNNPLFKQAEHSRDRFLCVVCKTDCGPGAEGSFVVCSFRCALVIAEKEDSKAKERTEPKDIQLEK